MLKISCLLGVKYDFCCSQLRMVWLIHSHVHSKQYRGLELAVYLHYVVHMTT